MYPPPPDRPHARLIAIGGPVTGLVLTLTDQSVSVGRDTTSDICLSDLALSRVHCTIDLQDGVWCVRDRQSSNGTFVNGTQVIDHALSDRDRITLGGSLFLFVVDRRGSRMPGLTDGSSQLVTHVRVDEDVYAHDAEAGTGSRVNHDLRALLRISTKINSVGLEEDLHRELLELLAETFAADQITLVTVGADGEYGIAASRQMPGAALLPVNNTLVRQALQERVGLRSRDAAAPAGCAIGAAATTVPAAQSILCVPLLVRDRALGALYVTAMPADAFDDDHLRLLTAIANVTAVAF